MNKKIRKMMVPMIVLGLCAIGIYLIIFHKRKEYYENRMNELEQESFQNKKPKVSKKLQNAYTNQEFTKDVANGNWTIPSTKFVNKKIVNYMTIQATDDIKKSFIQWNENGKMSRFLINLFSNMEIHAIDKPRNRSIHIYFSNLNDVLNPLRLERIPRCKVEYFENNKKTNEFYSYKLFSLDTISAKFSQLIESQQFYPDPKMKYNIPLYLKYVEKYQYPLHPFTVTYQKTTMKPTTFTNKIEKDYKNTIYVQYQREYYVIGSETIKTPLSKLYPILVKDKNKKWMNEITLNEIKKENEWNHIQKPFTPKKTFVYVLKMKNTKNTYTFDSKKTINQSSLGWKNGAEQLLNNEDVDFMNPEDMTMTMEGIFDLVLLKEEDTKDALQKVKIGIKDLEMVL
jgi:hypothetical protein